MLSIWFGNYFSKHYSYWMKEVVILKFKLRSIKLYIFIETFSEADRYWNYLMRQKLKRKRSEKADNIRNSTLPLPRGLSKNTSLQFQNIYSFKNTWKIAWTICSSLTNVVILYKYFVHLKKLSKEIWHWRAGVNSICQKILKKEHFLCQLWLLRAPSVYILYSWTESKVLSFWV